MAKLLVMRGMGRPPLKPTDEQKAEVTKLAGLGNRHDDIAMMMGIAPKTLRRHFREELDRAALDLNTQVMQTLFNMATLGSNTSATIFWAKTRCGLRENNREREKEEYQPPPFRLKLENKQ